MIYKPLAPIHHSRWLFCKITGPWALFWDRGGEVEAKELLILQKFWCKPSSKGEFWEVATPRSWVLAQGKRFGWKSPRLHGIYMRGLMSPRWRFPVTGDDLESLLFSVMQQPEGSVALVWHLKVRELEAVNCLQYMLLRFGWHTPMATAFCLLCQTDSFLHAYSQFLRGLLGGR